MDFSATWKKSLSIYADIFTALLIGSSSLRARAALLCPLAEETHSALVRCPELVLGLASSGSWREERVTQLETLGSICFNAACTSICVFANEADQEVGISAANVVVLKSRGEVAGIWPNDAHDASTTMVDGVDNDNGSTGMHRRDGGVRTTSIKLAM